MEIPPGPAPEKVKKARISVIFSFFRPPFNTICSVLVDINRQYLVFKGFTKPVNGAIICSCRRFSEKNRLIITCLDFGRGEIWDEGSKKGWSYR